jgi:hypothetical protein
MLDKLTDRSRPSKRGKHQNTFNVLVRTMDDKEEDHDEGFRVREKAFTDNANKF